MILNRSSGEDSVLVTSKYLYVSATTIASSFYYFSLIFPKSSKRYIRELFWIIFLNTCIIALVVFSNGVIYSAGKGSSGEVLIHFGRYYFVYVLYIFALFGISFVRFYFKYLNLKEEKQKGKVFWLFLGYTTSGIVSFIADIIIPVIHSSKYCWIGPASTIFLASSVTYAVKRHHLFNIKVITTEIFVLLLWIFTLVNISAFEQHRTPVTSVIFLLVFIIIGILLIRRCDKLSIFLFHKR